MKTKFGAIIVAGSGKVGGHVASKNRSGSYLRTKVTPINPQSALQTAVRGRLASLASAWGSLTAAQRDAWNAAVSSFKSTNVFGDIINPSGFNLFIKLNSNLLALGVAQISDPPVPVAVSTLTALSLTADVSDNKVEVTFSPTPVPAGFKLVIEATPEISAGRSFVKNDFRTCKIVAAAGASPSDISSEWNALFGDVTNAGKQVFVRCKLVSSTTGQAGIPVVASTVIVA